MPNQHNPLPPEDDIREPLREYYDLGLNDKEIAEHLKSHYDTRAYGCSITSSVKRFRKKWGLKSTRQQKHTPETILQYVLDIKSKYPHRGTLAVRKNLRQEFGMHVAENTVKEVLKQIEPEAVRQRKGKKFRRAKFYAAGVNDCWAQDQHDKWGPRFGLWLHNGIDPFTGFNNWLRVWWTNKNPRLITKYYLDACRQIGGVPMFTQSDPGNENNGVANTQTIIRQKLDARLVGTLQHNWKREKNNVKSEANWSQFRSDLAPGLEDLFEGGVQNGWYDVGNPLENLVFRWLAIPFVQVQLNVWVNHRNRTKPRRDKHKVLPHGIPELLRSKPEFHGLVDFKIVVRPEMFDEMEAQFAPPDHEVFLLVPPEFQYWAGVYYDAMGCPEVTHRTFWDIYRELLDYFNQVSDVEVDLQIPLSSHNETLRRVDEEDVPVLPGQLPFKQVAAMPHGPDAATVASGSRAPITQEYGRFTPDLEEEEEEEKEEDFD
ncbi:hypothetical protein FB45DRAFT_1150186 [Roridomyces roridus]|uniref:Uncharacterized protein n=1 Tax=Roridomyces roridus TaxID=1738132 RepID=A0AAD7FNM8_9AGAR|nr:hypothetical protein FB45DRAFT_1150186 [Roridomyces roridus]